MRKKQKRRLIQTSLKPLNKDQEGKLAEQAFKSILKDQNRWQERFGDRGS